MTDGVSRRVRVPGKLMLAGEYAVLAGAPSIVACVDRFVTVVIEAADGDTGRVTLAGFDGGVHEDRIADGVPLWLSPPTAPALVDAVLRAVGPVPVRISADSAAFYEGQRKLGLGSSAAVAVALATALTGAADPVDALPRALAAHSDFQGGAGSGADVRAVAHGGTIVQVASRDDVRVERLAWPAGLEACAVVAARAADTVDRVRRFARWREQDRAAGRLLDTASAAAARVVAEWRHADATAIIAAMKVFTREVGRVDRAAGLGYFDGGHEALAEVAAEVGCCYKPCGAGGGDLGVAFADAPARIARFADAARASGFTVPGLDIGRARPEVLSGGSP